MGMMPKGVLSVLGTWNLMLAQTWMFDRYGNPCSEFGFPPSCGPTTNRGPVVEMMNKDRKGDIGGDDAEGGVDDVN